MNKHNKELINPRETQEETKIERPSWIFWKKKKHTVGNLLLVQQISMQVFPTAPSPTVTHLMNLEALEAIENQTKKILSELNKHTYNKNTQIGGL